MLKNEDLKEYYKEKYFNLSQAVLFSCYIDFIHFLKLEIMEMKKNPNNTHKKTNVNNSEKNAHPHINSKLMKKNSILSKNILAPQLDHNNKLMDIEESHFVSEGEYQKKLKDIQSLEEELDILSKEKLAKQQALENYEQQIINDEEELKQILTNNFKLRSKLEDSVNQKTKLLEKKKEIETELKQLSEKLSLQQHKVK